jgi:hypothetical protein
MLVLFEQDSGLDLETHAVLLPGILRYKVILYI